MKIKMLSILIIFVLIAGAIPVTGENFFKKSKKMNDFIPLDKSETPKINWPMYRNNLDHTSYSTSPAPKTNRLALSSRVDGIVRSSPAIIDDNMYFGSNEFYCCDSNTGVIIWSYQTDDFVISAPAVYDGNVFFGDYNGTIYCLNASGNGDNTTDLIWTYQTGARIVSSPSIAYGNIYIGSDDGNVYCLNASGNGDNTTDLEWIFPTGGEVESSPAIYNDRVYVGSNDYSVYCIDATDGTLKWEFLSDGKVRSSPSIYNNFVYIGTESVGNMYCIYMSNGTEKWAYTGGINSSVLSPAIAFGNIYFSVTHINSGAVVCIDANNGELKWEYNTSYKMNSSPSIAHGKLYVGLNLSEVCCMDAENGKHIWTYYTNGLIVCSPSIASGTVYIGSDDGNIYGFAQESYPPDDPVIHSGPKNAGSEIELYYSASTVHPYNYQIYYMWDFGDGNITDWIGPYESGESNTVNHSWLEDGTYEIRVKSKDHTDNESEWSDPYTIAIEKQIEIDSIDIGFMYIWMWTFNKSFMYLELLEEMGASVIISDEGMRADVTTTDVVANVTFEFYDWFWNETYIFYNNDGSDGFSLNTNEILTGILQLTVSAIDEDGNLIDRDVLDYLFYLNMYKDEQPQQMGIVGKIRHRLRNRILNR